MSIEAMKQALEALIDTTDALSGRIENETTALHNGLCVITLLRQAIKTEQQSTLSAYQCGYTDGISDGRQAIARAEGILEAEKQEPVTHFGSAYVNENGVHVTTVLGPVAIPQDAKLYTSLPLRPLTEKQICDIYDEVARTSDYMGTVTRIDLVRAIEAAHGIRPTDLKEEA